MSQESPKSLAELIFRPGSPVGDLARQAAAAVNLATRLRAGLAAELAGEVRSAVLRNDGTVVVLVSSPAWAARLRFEARTLLDRARAHDRRASRVEVRVAGPDD